MINSKLKEELNNHGNNSDPNDYTIESWEDLFTLQGRKDGANYTLLKNWLENHFELPKMKNK